LLVPITLLGFYYLARESLTWGDLTGLEKTRAAASVRAHELEGPLTDIELVQEGEITEGDNVALAANPNGIEAVETEAAVEPPRSADGLEQPHEPAPLGEATRPASNPPEKVN